MTTFTYSAMSRRQVKHIPTPDLEHVLVACNEAHCHADAMICRRELTKRGIDVRAKGRARAA